VKVMANLSQSCESKMWEVAYELRLRKSSPDEFRGRSALISTISNVLPNSVDDNFQWILDSVGQARYKDEWIAGDIMECLDLPSCQFLT
jgi:ABC-type iron transport system FetAB ATPase subunit